MNIKLLNGKVYYQKKCSITKTEYSVEISFPDFMELRSRKRVIQDILPNLSADEREFIKTGKTPAEWDKMFEEPK